LDRLHQSSRKSSRRLIDNDIVEKNVASWITCPERLEKAGISWRVYQKSSDYDEKRPFDGNYGDNPLAYIWRMGYRVSATRL
jgi:Phospholipase C